MRSFRETLVLKVNPHHPDKAHISLGAKAVKEGSLVAFPTETVYGIAANLSDKNAIRRLYKVKARPKEKPFTIHIAGLSMIKKMDCPVRKEARALIRKFWPGPLTIILRSRNGSKIGFRMPANRVALSLIKRTGSPVVAPSANLSGGTPPVSADEVLKELGGKIDMVLDAGRTRIGVESTVLDMSVDPPKILREGAVKAADIMRVIRDA
jgi:L-threonylcarbamoyladenylate synthase